MEIIALSVLGVLLAVYLGYSVGWRYSRQHHSWMGDEETLSLYQARADRAVQARIRRRLGRIMEKAQAAGRITNDDVEDMFCIGDRTASRYLRQLVAEGRLRREGVGRGTTYVPATDDGSKKLA